MWLLKLIYPAIGYSEENMNTLGRILCAAALAGSVSSALAATASTTFAVTANVQPACTVSANPLGFGTYPVNSSAAIDGQTTITVTCPNTLPYSVGLTSANAFKMVSGTSNLNYALFSDSGRTTSFPLGSQTGNGLAQTINVYGRIAALQSPSATGTHTDTVTVTVTY
jgi:spore coat protein U-like protein